MLLTTTDVWSQLRPRNVDRKQRRPGARERHTSQRERFSERPGTTGHKAHAKVPVSQPQQHCRSSYSMSSAVTDFGANLNRNQNEHVKEEQTITKYQELSTLDDIRKSMVRTERAKSAPPKHVPDWMVKLDINLDISSSDIIPPYDDTNDVNTRASETFSERASFVFMENDSDDDYDNNDDDDVHIKSGTESKTNKTKANNNNIQNTINTKGQEAYDQTVSKSQVSSKPSTPTDSRLQTHTFRVAGRFSPNSMKFQNENSSPRRYQGDKKVMSLQQGGIRSTPFQPKAKKYINQMITFNHMKHHDRKLRVAKPAVDTKMPASFRIAIDRKRLVEQRLTDSWLREIESSTPIRSVSSEQASPRKSKDRSKEREYPNER